VELSLAGVGKAVEHASGNVDAFARGDGQEIVAESYRCRSREKMQNLFARMGMIEHALAWLEPLLSEVELRRAIRGVDKMLQREIAGTSPDRLSVCDHF
jgi:hypothetical protein